MRSCLDNDIIEDDDFHNSNSSGGDDDGDGDGENVDPFLFIMQSLGSALKEERGELPLF